MRVPRFVSIVALLLALAGSGQAFAAANFDGFVTIAGNNRQIAVSCDGGKIVTVMEMTTVGVILPLQAIGKDCDATMLAKVFPETVLTSNTDPTQGWAESTANGVEKVSICIGSSITRFSVTDGTMTVDIALNAEECPL